MAMSIVKESFTTVKWVAACLPFYLAFVYYLGGLQLNGAPFEVKLAVWIGFPLIAIVAAFILSMYSKVAAKVIEEKSFVSSTEAPVYLVRGFENEATMNLYDELFYSGSEAKRYFDVVIPGERKHISLFNKEVFQKLFFQRQKGYIHFRQFIELIVHHSNANIDEYIYPEVYKKSPVVFLSYSTICGKATCCRIEYIPPGRREGPNFSPVKFSNYCLDEDVEHVKNLRRVKFEA